MKNYLLILLFILVGISTYAQITFEKGYFIDNNSDKVECFIKNIDWQNNPNEFLYKLLESGEVKKGTLEFITEFGIEQDFKYQRFTVGVDRSTNNISELSLDRNSNFKVEELFLKVLVEGKSTLFYYQDEGLERFFINVEGKEAKQLEYKKFKTEKGEVVENVNFKQQLWNSLICSNIKKAEIERIKYQKKDLVSLFIKYNECSNATYFNYDYKEKGEFFHLSLRLGLNVSSLEIQDTKFESESSFRLGGEMEYILPFNKGKWSVLLEPSYQSYHSTKEMVYERSFLPLIKPQT